MPGFSDMGIVGPWSTAAFEDALEVPRWATKIQVIVPTIDAGIVSPMVAIGNDTDWYSTFSSFLTRATSYPTEGSFTGESFDEFFVPGGNGTYFKLGSGVSQTAKFMYRFV